MLSPSGRRPTSFLSTSSTSASASASSSSSSSSASASASASPSSTAEDLASWVEARGGFAPRDRVAVFAEGASRGLALRCVSGAKRGDVLVRLPASCLLHGDDDDASSSSSSALSSLLPEGVEAAVARLCSRVPPELWGARLALRLLAHRAAGDASPLAPYLRALPAGVPGVPIFFPKSAVDVLQEYAPVGAQVLKRCRFLASFVEREGLLEAPSRPGSDAAIAFSGAAVDASALAWAFSISTSRAFRVRGEERAPSCLPLIDMANHDFAPTARVVPWRREGGVGGSGSGNGSGSGSGSSSGSSSSDDPGGAAGAGVALVAEADLEPGTPLTLNYGALPSDFFLLDYGFFAPYPGNPFDVVKLRWSQSLVDAAADFARVRLPGGGASASSSLSASPWKAAALAPLSLQSDPEVRVLAAHPWVDGRFLAAARVAAAASPADVRGRSLASFSSSSGFSSSSSSKSDPSLADLDRGFLADPAAEARALRLLGGACLLSLAAFPTAPEQDRALLRLGAGEEGALKSADEVAARRFILSKKEMLERAAKEMGARARAAAARAKGGGSGGGGGGEKSKGFGGKK